MMRMDNYESQQDDDYEPTKMQEHQFKHQQQKVKKVGSSSKVSVDELWNQLQRDEKRKAELKKVKLEPLANPMEAAAKILTCKQIRCEKKVMFAGKEFIMDEISGELRQVEKQALVIQKHIDSQHELTQREILQNKYNYLNHVVNMLRSRYRNINSIHKSKMDWKSFVKKEGIEDKLNYNRKGGALEDYKFMKKVEQRH